MNNIAWQNIRTWNGSKAGGFQELCVQLARLEAHDSSKFMALGVHDAGVECYCVLPDGDEWGWQAKYFTSSLTKNQWQQLDSSVNTALDKHPKLVRYYVCVPRDRSDARVTNQTSEMDKWNDHVSKWETRAHNRGMNVRFVWWGSSELIDRLSREEHAGRRFFWFGQHEFGQNWFDLHLAESVETAGPRYTQEVHVDLPIAQDMERFSRSGSSFDQVKALSLGVRRVHNSLMLIHRSSDRHANGFTLDGLSNATSKVLDALKRLEPSPVGYIPFPEIVKAADKACNEGIQVLEHIRQLQREEKPKPEDTSASSGYYGELLGNIFLYVRRLQLTLQEVAEVCIHFGSLANSQLLLLKGDGGAGKTHLLCDFAKRRIQGKLPTLLLMGERFLSENDPWVQLLQQLDLSQGSAEEFVGALESSAQASGCRALVMIDALNEGNGRKIWLAHLSSFLARLEKSPWIGVILSVRSSYEETLIPKNVRDQSAVITHHGFTGHELDAARIFFAHYGLELPSTPILQPEFSNPLFLKAICEGLQGRGERRLPKGFHGITAVFDLYLKAIHERLWNPESLDYDPNSNLVRQALERLAERLAEHETRRLPRSEAQTIVNNLLPGRDYGRSIYAALVAEGILTEDMDPTNGGLSEEVVSITYDRFADQIISDHLLSTHLDADDPDTAFSENGGLAFLREEDQYVRYGLVEALCIQVPERTGKELVRLSPAVMKRPNIANAFLQSIIWRKHDAFSEDTHVVLDYFSQREDIWEELLDTVMSVSTVPGHPFNADSLNRQLRRDSMPDRDSWWSIYLHMTWGIKGPVDRLIDWATNLSSDDDIEDEVVDLSATALAWTFTTPNRFLRDSATKALVVLLTGRLAAAHRMVSRFFDVDDPYVRERVYAVAYGVAMRSHDPVGIGLLASLVYEKVFASGSPAVHILLRDYARGVVERAIHLGSDIPIHQDLIHPPYRSIWPEIPGDDVIEDLFPDETRGAWARGDLEWSRKRIRHTVESKFLGDFAKYVIGTETESNWLKMRLDEATWQSPEQRLQDLVSRLEEVERLAWEVLQEAEGKVPPLASWFTNKRTDKQTIEQAKAKVELAREKLMAELSAVHRAEWNDISEDAKNYETRRGPRLDKSVIQRYILWRVFDLGWTIERFGRFDRFDVGDDGRAAAKAERMGKKYQWIAYHEILAYIADHYQYREKYDDDVRHAYVGPWQESLRDIDPSCASKATPGGTSWGPHKPAWWAAEDYEEWNEDGSLEDWVADRKALPSIAELIEVVNPGDGTRWLNLDGFLVWRQPHPPDIEAYDNELRELWIMITGYLVRKEEAESFMSWARTVNFMGRWMPEPPRSPSIYLGEYGWAPAFEYERSIYSDFDAWVKPRSRGVMECPVTIRPASFRYFSESGGFDCSIEESFNLNLPCREITDHLCLKAKYNGVEYVDENDNIVIQDPTAHDAGPSALLFNKDFAERYLRENNLTICWTVLGEKLITGGHPRDKNYGRLEMSGAYNFTTDGLVGFMNLQSS